MELIKSFKDDYNRIVYIYRCVDCGGEARYRRKPNPGYLPRCLCCTNKRTIELANKRFRISIYRELLDRCQAIEGHCVGTNCPFWQLKGTCYLKEVINVQE